MIKILGILALLTLGACSLLGDAKQTLATKGAEFMDEGLNDAEWFMCYAASVGSVRRRYGKSVERSTAWRELCEPNPQPTAIGRPIEPRTD